MSKRITLPPIDLTRHPEVRTKLEQQAKKAQRPLSDYVRIVLMRHVLKDK